DQRMGRGLDADLRVGLSSGEAGREFHVLQLLDAGGPDAIGVFQHRQRLLEGVWALRSAEDSGYSAGDSQSGGAAVECERGKNILVERAAHAAISRGGL